MLKFVKKSFYINYFNFFKQNADVPTEVQSLKAFKTSSKNITVGWQPPKDDGESTLTAYAIEVQCVQDEAHEWIKVCIFYKKSI